MPIDVVLAHPGGNGWGPITRMAGLAAEYFGGEFIDLPPALGPYSPRTRLRTLLPRRRRAGQCVIIAPRPENLQSALVREILGRRYETVAGWVIDSFMHDRIPRVARVAGHFDRLYVTDASDLAAWQASCSAPVGVLPWGSDTSRYQNVPKRVDLQRIGRQPTAWDDDESNALAARARGLSYGGRPPFGDSDVTSMLSVDRAVERARLVLAFSNLVDGSTYTHGARDYLTGRWTDALAAGACVVGIAPRSDTARSLLWPGACLELADTDRTRGLETIGAWLEGWSDSVAERNREWARKTLDWRLRFAQLAEDVDADTADERQSQ